MINSLLNIIWCKPARNDEGVADGDCIVVELEIRQKISIAHQVWRNLSCDDLRDMLELELDRPSSKSARSPSPKFAIMQLIL